MINRCWIWCLSWCDVLFSFVLIVRNCMKLLICGDVVDIDVNMLNADCWWWIYTCLMWILNMAIACIELCYWFLICKFDDDSCGACMYEMCLFWWWIMLLNHYMQTMVLLMVNAYLHKWSGLGYLYPVVWFVYFVFNGLGYIYIYPMVMMLVSCCWTCA